MSTDLYRVLDKLRAAWSTNRAEITGRILRGNESLAPIAYWLDRLGEAMAERPALGVDVAELVRLLEDVRPAVRARNKGYDGESGRDLVDEIDATLRALKLRAVQPLIAPIDDAPGSCGRRDGTQYRCQKCHRCGHEFDADYAGGSTERTAYHCDGAGDLECENLICWTCLLKSELCSTCQDPAAVGSLCGAAEIGSRR